MTCVGLHLLLGNLSFREGRESTTGRTCEPFVVRNVLKFKERPFEWLVDSVLPPANLAAAE